MLNELTSHLLDDWDRLFSDKQRPDKIRYLGIPGSVEGGTTTFLAFDGHQPKPFCSVKLHRHPNEDDRAQNELAVLETIRKGSVAESVPRSILGEKIGHSWVLVQSILEGAPMTVSLTSDGRPEISSTQKNSVHVSDWLLRLQQETVSHAEQPKEKLIRRLTQTTEEFLSLFDLSTTEKESAVASVDAMRAFLSSGVSVQHGDFCRQNILVDQQRGKTCLNIIDWTDSQPEGAPLHDLFCFLSTYFLQVRKTAGIRGFVSVFEELFLSCNPLSDLLANQLVAHSRQVGCPTDGIRHLMTLFLIEQSMFEYHKLLKYSQRGGLPRFTLYLASLGGKSYQEALKEQLWIYFFRAFVKQHRQFII